MIVEKTQETRPGMSSETKETGHWEHHKIIEKSCSVPCDSVNLTQQDYCHHSHHVLYYI